MSESRIDQGVFKIFRMTHEGQLNWEPATAAAQWQEGADTLYPVFFQTEYEGRKLALFESKERPNSRHRSIGEINNAESNERSESVHLALLGDNGELLFEFPRSRVIRDLFIAVRYKAAKVDDFLDKLLKTEPENEK